MEGTILIATGNPGKAREFQLMFNKLGYGIETLKDYPELPEVIEDGETFRANAYKKAKEISDATGKLVLADDSGLIVDALDGEPGVYSARYAGEPKSDVRNYKKVLEQLEGLSKEERTARFHTTLAIVEKERDPLFVEGDIEGYIIEESRGENGFGYDPIFYVPSKEKTMAELTDDEKNELSHRAVALKKLETVWDYWRKDDLS